MKTNFTQAKSWFSSAIIDIEYVLDDLESKSFARIAFRSQLATEKFNKALLNLMGLKIEKTHTPTKILNKFLKDKETLNLNQKEKKMLKNIIKISKIFEDTGTKTRYGVHKEGKIIFPEEIYKSFEDVKDFIINLKDLINDYLDGTKINLYDMFCILFH